MSTSLVPVSFALTGPVAGAIGIDATLIGAGVLGAASTIGFLFWPGLRGLDRPGAVDRTAAAVAAAHGATGTPVPGGAAPEREPRWVGEL